jgi:demethylmenaquinone methyltransferase/2-methoxy-6-polyprenyl-1,4-benzoquinol methylase
MAGTGEVWPHLLKAAPNIDTITAIDISAGMHKRALERLHQHRAHRIRFIEDDALNSSLPDDSADFLVSTFGLKTFNAEQHKRLAALVARVLKPGGTFALIEVSDPKGWALRPLYLFHLKQVLPVVERVFLNGAQDFSMIGQYSTRFGNAGQFTQDLRAEGLAADCRKLFYGCATAAFGRKPLRD